MKKLAILALLFSMVLGTVSAQEAFSVDAGAGLSFGLMESSESSGLEGFAVFMSTLRGAAYANGRLNISEELSVGARIGLYAITFESETESTTLVDIPFHALVSFNLGFIGVEGFGGYYLSAVSTPDFNLSGAEVGAKVFLGPVYGSFSQVFAGTPFQRFELGFELTDLVEF